MKLVDHTEVGKYYAAYWETSLVKIVIIFKQIKNSSCMDRISDSVPHFVYQRTCRFKCACDVQVNYYSSLTLSRSGIALSPTIYELNSDDINKHILMENI